MVTELNSGHVVQASCSIEFILLQLFNLHLNLNTTKQRNIEELNFAYLGIYHL